MYPVYCFDPTLQDEQSKVRGVGRYLQILKENLSDQMTFVGHLRDVPKQSIFIHPFLNPLQPPLKIGKIAVKQIGIIHDVIPLKYPQFFPSGWRGKWYKFLNSFAIKAYDVILTDSFHSRSDIVKCLQIPQKKIAIVYPTVTKIFFPHLDENPADHHPFHSTEQGSQQEFTQIDWARFSKNTALQGLKDYVIYVGDATWNKNLVNLAKAIKIANVPCVFVGKVFEQCGALLKAAPHTLNPWQQPLYEFAKLAQGDQRFIFPGFINDIELLQLYKLAKANILVSYDEGFGFSFVEAAFMSTPSILSLSPIAKEIAGDAGLFVNPADPRAIAQAIAVFFYDQTRREKENVEAFTRAQDFNAQQFRKGWLQVLEYLQR